MSADHNATGRQPMPASGRKRFKRHFNRSAADGGKRDSQIRTTVVVTDMSVTTLRRPIATLSRHPSPT